MTKDVQDAIRILRVAAESLVPGHTVPIAKYQFASKTVWDAIHHLAYPDRDTYPKTRRGTKGAPIVRR